MRKAPGLFFLLIAAFCTPASAGYSWQLARVIDHTKVGAADLANFTFPVVLTNSRLRTTAKSGSVVNTVPCGVNAITCPADLIFSSTACATPTPMNWHFDSYSPVSGTIVAKVKAAAVSHSIDTAYWICVGNAAVTTFQGGQNGSEFDSLTAAQYALSDGSVLSVRDTSANAADAVNHGATAVAGKVDGAAAFSSGSSQSIASNVILGNTNFAQGTVCAWAYSNNSYNDGLKDILFGQLDAGTGEELVGMKWENNNLYFGWRTSAGGDRRVVIPATPENFPQNSWNQYCLSWTNGGTTALYLNGALLGTNTLTPVTVSPGTNPLSIGTEPGSGAYWDGGVDEFRLSASVRSADWILAEYNSQNSPATFSTGAQWDSLDGGGVIIPPVQTLSNIKVQGLIF